MADYKLLIPFVIKWEGGYVNDPDDSGGATNRGITYSTYKSLASRVLGVSPTIENFKTLTKDQAGLFLKYFWDKATYNNSIKSQAVAEAITTWFWGSGVTGLKEFQRLVNTYGNNLTVDGVIGPATVKAINNIPGLILFNDAIKAREKFFRDLVARRSKDAKFLKGWLNRLKSFNERHKKKL